MKNVLTIISACAMFALSSLGGGLDKSAVPADAKWVLHLDMEAFRATKTGAYVTENILEKKLAAAKEKIKTNLSLSFLNTSGITIYGRRFNQPGEREGILLIKTTADLKKDLDALMGLAALSNDGKKITRVQENPFVLYNLDDRAYVALDVGGTAVLAKTKAEVESACDVLLKKEENLSANASFSRIATGDGAFFFLGAVQGLTDAPVPPNAQVLKETDGGRLILGEKEDKVFADLLLQGKTAEAAMKIQQIFQGLVALGSLNTEKKDLNDLANAAKVTADGQEVRVKLEFPVSRAIEHIEEKAKHKN